MVCKFHVGLFDFSIGCERENLPKVFEERSEGH